MRDRIGTAIFFILTVALAAHGCIAASNVAITTGMAQGEDKSAKVVVPEVSDRVYEVALSVLEKESDIEIIKKDPYRLVIEAKKEDVLITIKSKHVVRGRTELVVIAHSNGEWKPGEDLALDIEKKICEELGMKYTVQSSAEPAA